MESSWQTRPATLLAVSVLAGAAGAAVMTVASYTTVESTRYVSTPAFKVELAAYIAVWAMTPTVWSVGVTALRRSSVNGSPLRQLHIRATALAVVVAAGAGIAGAYARGADKGEVHGLWRGMATYAAAAFAAYPAFAAMWTSGRASHHLAASPPGPADKAMAALAGLRAGLTQTLTVLGALVSVGVFAAGAQRQAWQAYSPQQADTYPPTYVLITGFALTLLLAAIFVPSWLRWTKAATRELDHRLAQLSPETPGWQTRASDRATYTAILQLPGAVHDQLTSAIIVLGPLTSSAVSLLLPAKG